MQVAQQMDPVWWEHSLTHYSDTDHSQRPGRGVLQGSDVRTKPKCKALGEVAVAGS